MIDLSDPYVSFIFGIIVVCVLYAMQDENYVEIDGEMYDKALKQICSNTNLESCKRIYFNKLK